MFKSLREKLSSWFKKDRDKEEKKISKVDKEQVEKKRSKKEAKKKEAKKKETKKREKKILVKAMGRAQESGKIKKLEEKKEEEKERIGEEIIKEVKGRSKEDEKYVGNVLSEPLGFGLTKEHVFDKQLKREASRIEHEVPLKFEVGKQKFEPDLDAVRGQFDEKFKEEKKEQSGFFAKLREKLSTSILKQEEFYEIFEDMEMTLLENNVALEAVDKIRESLGKNLVGVRVKKSEVEKTILESLKNAISEVLLAADGEELYKEIEKSSEPYVILFFGINGSGKTTSIAKFAYLLKSKGISCVLAAADTFRAASIEQLETHASRLGVPLVKKQYGGDPAAVGFDALAYAKKYRIKVVLIDTAGRMYTKSNLMKEMEKIVRVTKPNLKIFVGESITGNDATEQAKMFDETAGIDGIILTKADVDEKAGAILSVSYVTRKPIFFLGVGQEYNDLREFRKEDVLKNLGLE